MILDPGKKKCDSCNCMLVRKKFLDRMQTRISSWVMSTLLCVIVFIETVPIKPTS